MSRILIEWVEKKTEDWYIVSGKDEDVEFKDASVNRKDKEGKEFPNFDGIEAGVTIEATLWSNPSGKNYIFAPRPQPVRKNGANMHAVMEKKSSMIAESQDKKAQNIKAAQDRSAWMWAKNNAVEIAIHLGKSDDLMLINDLATKIYNMELLAPFND